MLLLLLSTTGTYDPASQKRTDSKFRIKHDRTHLASFKFEDRMIDVEASNNCPVKMKMKIARKPPSSSHCVGLELVREKETAAGQASETKSQMFISSSRYSLPNTKTLQFAPAASAGDDGQCCTWKASQPSWTIRLT